MAIIFDGTLGITSPGGDTSNTSHTTPIVKSSANLVFQTNGTTEAMRILANGNVGIGTNSPSYALTVTGGAGQGALIYSAGTTNGGVLLLRNTTSSDYTWRMGVGGGDNAYVVGRGFFIRDDTAGATRFLIDSDGRIGIGTTGTNSNYLIALGNNGSGISTSGGDFIHRLGSGSGLGENISYGGSFYLHHDGRTCSTLGFGNIACSRNYPAYSSRNNGGGAAYYAEAGGFTGPSDYRLKENIVPLTDGIDKVKQLKPIIFDYTDEAHWEDGNARHDGFLAHEVQEVVPDAVFGEKDAVDEDGKMIIQSLDKSRLIPLLTAAIQELNAKVEALEAQLKEQAK
jgi:hypothetical protein